MPRLWLRGDCASAGHVVQPLDLQNIFRDGVTFDAPRPTRHGYPAFHCRVTASLDRADARLRCPDSHQIMSLGVARRGQGEDPLAPVTSPSGSTDKGSGRQLTNFPSTFPRKRSQNPSSPPSRRGWGCLNEGLKECQVRGQAEGCCRLCAQQTTAEAGAQGGRVERSTQATAAAMGGQGWKETPLVSP